MNPERYHIYVGSIEIAAGLLGIGTMFGLAVAGGTYSIIFFALCAASVAAGIGLLRETNWGIQASLVVLALQLIHVTSPLLNFTMMTQLPLSVMSTLEIGGETGWNASVGLAVFSIMWESTLLGDFQKWEIGFNFTPLLLIWMVDQYVNTRSEEVKEASTRRT
jgi:hypothetical protein